jgi:alpha-galactosidase
MFGAVGAMTAPVPATLPRPDGKPADMTKKVKVYILAGQSNMVGFGMLAGAAPVYPGIFHSADPAALPCRMPVGTAALLPLKVYQSAASDAPPGAKVAIYPGAHDPKADYAAMKPVKEATVALGTVAENLPAIDGAHTLVARTFVEVPATGTYLVHPGCEDSTHAIATLDGKEVYRRNPGEKAALTKATLEQGKRYPVVITYLKSGSAAFWLEQVDIKGKGDLTTCIAAGKFPWFADADGKWTVRNDVIYRDVRLSQEPLGSGGPLSATSNGGRSIGPEVPFGFVMGTYHEEPVLLIESSIGNRSLNWDFRPPSSGKTDRPGADQWEGVEYRLMVEGVHKVLKNLDKVVPGYQGQGYEITGFVWWQGHKDSGSTKEEYEKHLVNLIQDLRKEFKAPDMRAVVATVGFDGFKLSEGPWQGVWEAQMAVGDPKQHPEFAGKVASVDTRGFWRSQGESPTGVGYHYNFNAETYALTGDALGRAMVELLGGKAEKLALPPEPARDPNVERIYSDSVMIPWAKPSGNPTPEQYRKMSQALRPIFLDRMVPEFIATASSGNSRELQGLLKGEMPAQTGAGISSPLDTLIGYFEAAGVSDYSWHAFGPEMKTAKWFYHSFDPPEKQDPSKSDRYRKITFPAGMENWSAPDFDPAAAGWKVGAAPFGSWGGKLEARRSECNGPLCGCSTAPTTLWEKEVLLMRQTFDLPPARKGHVYRFILGGAGCDRSGEGFAIYVNGKQVTQVNGGFYRNPGIRGAYVHSDCLSEFKGGKVTIAVINFLRYTHFNNSTIYFGPRAEYDQKPVPPNGHVSLWLEEAQVPPALMKAFEGSK